MASTLRSKDFGSRLVACRERREWTQAALAARLRDLLGDSEELDRGAVAHSHISRWESGKHSPSIETVELLASALCVEPGMLAYGQQLGIESMTRLREVVSSLRDSTEKAQQLLSAIESSSQPAAANSVMAENIGRSDDLTLAVLRAVERRGGSATVSYITNEVRGFVNREAATATLEKMVADGIGHWSGKGNARKFVTNPEKAVDFLAATLHPGKREETIPGLGGAVRFYPPQSTDPHVAKSAPLTLTYVPSARIAATSEPPPDASAVESPLAAPPIAELIATGIVQPLSPEDAARFVPASERIHTRPPWMLYSHEQALKFPLLPEAIAAGPGADLEASDRVLQDLLANKQYTVRFVARGDSMVPTILDGDQVLVDLFPSMRGLPAVDDDEQTGTSREDFLKWFRNGEVYMVSLGRGEGWTLKRAMLAHDRSALAGWRLMVQADNPAYPMEHGLPTKMIRRSDHVLFAGMVRGYVCRGGEQPGVSRRR